MKKKCASCGKIKSIKNFYKRSAPKAHLYTGYCAECIKKRSVKWRELNRERFNAYQREYSKKKYAKNER